MHDYLYLLAFLSGCFSVNFNGFATTFSHSRFPIATGPFFVIKTGFQKKIPQMRKKSWTTIWKKNLNNDKNLSLEQNKKEISKTFQKEVPSFRYLFKYHMINTAAIIAACCVYVAVWTALGILVCMTSSLFWETAIK